MELRLVSDRQELAFGRPLLNLDSIFDLGLLLTLRVIEPLASPLPYDVRYVVCRTESFGAPVVPEDGGEDTDHDADYHPRQNDNR